MIVSIIYINYNKKESIFKGDETLFVGKIYKLKISSDKSTIYIKNKENIVINYYQKLDQDINLGDTILVEGTIALPKNNTIPNQFNYKKYLYNNDIYYILSASSIKKIANNTNIIYHFRNIILKRINSINYANEYIKIFILGDTNSLSEDIIKSYQQNGISHLFSISGMHISLFASILLFFLKRISYNNYYNYGIVIIFLTIYSILVGSTPSVIRSLITYILSIINKLFNLSIKKPDIMLLVLIIMLIINPYNLVNISFQYSYLISFSLVIFNYQIKKIKSKLLKSLYISLISFLVSFPICIYNFYQVNILSILLNIILIPLISTIIFPLSLITFIIPKISIILNIFIKLLETISLFFYNNNLGTIFFSKPNILTIVIYYICIYFFIYNKKNIYILLLIIIHKLFPYIDPSTNITYLDIGQGDSIVIKFPNNKNNILIDTGGLINSDYSIALNKTIPYLKSIGINKINYLILTHGDNDHMGDSIDLIENFKVDKVIFNCGEYNELENELINVLKKKNITYYSCIKELSIDNYKLQFLNTEVYDNENDNSSVIYLNYNNYKFLFMGDASTSREKDILNNYNLNNIDFLKIGHHGSDTSSGEEFINSINPKYSIISVGKNNKYGHPKISVLDTLEKNNSKIYRTDIDGSIEIKIKSDGYTIETCEP